MANPDSYYLRTEVSNSDLTELKNYLYPRTQYGDKEKAFKFGTLVDALITENERVHYSKRMVDDVTYSREDFELGLAMREALRKEARKDEFLRAVLSLDTRCKWDWWLPSFGFGGDLKTTFAESQNQFNEAIDFFDWDRSRAWYMDIAGSQQDSIYAISKKNLKIFKAFIRRDDDTYKRGKEKYDELAFKWWQLMV